LSKLSVYLSDETERDFKITVIKKIGTKKGSINQAFGEAIALWMREVKRRKPDESKLEQVPTESQSDPDTNILEPEVVVVLEKKAEQPKEELRPLALAATITNTPQPHRPPPPPAV